MLGRSNDLNCVRRLKLAYPDALLSASAAMRVYKFPAIGGGYGMKDVAVGRQFFDRKGSCEKSGRGSRTRVPDIGCRQYHQNYRTDQGEDPATPSRSGLGDNLRMGRRV